jgi:hypothetical protein
MYLQKNGKHILYSNNIVTYGIVYSTLLFSIPLSLLLVFIIALIISIDQFIFAVVPPLVFSWTGMLFALYQGLGVFIVGIYSEFNEYTLVTKNVLKNKLKEIDLRDVDTITVTPFARHVLLITKNGVRVSILVQNEDKQTVCRSFIQQST